MRRDTQYHQYRNGRYPIPNDDAEQNRDDMKHALTMELTEYVHPTTFRAKRRRGRACVPP